MLLKSSNRLASRLPDSTYFVRHALGAMYSRQPGTTQSSTTCHHRNADRRRHMEQAKGARGAERDAPGALPKGARRKQEQKPRRRIRNELVPVSFVLLRPRARPEISASNLTRHLLKIKPLLGFGSIYQGGREAGMDHGLRGPPVVRAKIKRIRRASCFNRPVLMSVQRWRQQCFARRADEWLVSKSWSNHLGVLAADNENTK